MFQFAWHKSFNRYLHLDALSLLRKVVTNHKPEIMQFEVFKNAGNFKRLITRLLYAKAINLHSTNYETSSF